MVGNPANTNALIAMNNAPDLDPGQFTAMTRLDHNRAIGPAGGQDRHATVNDITKMTIWGNHSTTQYPDLFHAEVDGKNAAELVGDQAWIDGTFIPTVAKRGAAIIEARGLSSAASAANAAIDHMRTWALGTADGRLGVSMAIPSDGCYGVPEGLISVVPVHHHGRRATRSCRASTSTTTPAARSTPRWPSWPRSATPSRARPDQVALAPQAALVSARR